MKRLAIFALLAFATGAAHADPITVATPVDKASKEQAIAYVTELDRAVKKVCADASAPLYGPNVHAYQACLKATRQDVETKDPTGLYASRNSLSGTALAVR